MGVPYTNLLLSGLLFKKEKFLCFRNFLASRFKSLLVPYAIFYLLTYIYWLLVERHVRGADISPISQLFGLVYGTYDMRFMMFNGALWFIPCLFSMEISFWLLAKSKRKGVHTILFIDFLCYRTIYEYCGRVVAMGNMCSVNRHGLL